MKNAPDQITIESAVAATASANDTPHAECIQALNPSDQQPSIQPRMVSGYGQFHTNEADPNNPDKKLKPYVTIDLDGIRALVDNPPSVEKQDAQWLIPSTLLSRNFSEQEKSGEYWMLWADLDKDPLLIVEVASRLRQLIPGCDFEIYTTKSATEENQKSRIQIPLTKPLLGADWVTCQGMLGDALEAAGMTPDRAAERPAQLCYLPNRGAFYASCSERQGHNLDPIAEGASAIEARRQAIKQAEQVLQQERLAATDRRKALKLTDAPDTIGAFNRAYTVQEILQRANYAQRGNTFRHPHSESGSYSASVKAGRVHSQSSSDPLYTGGAGGGAHDAFSAFCILFAGGDEKVALKLAGDEWLAIDSESWNVVKQREYHQRESNVEFVEGAFVEDDDSAQKAPDPGLAAFPAPYPGAMTDTVNEAVRLSHKRQPELCTMSTLIGMASACPGDKYRLPSGMRLNLYGMGMADTGTGKDLPIRLSTAINRASEGMRLSPPASGQGLEDALTNEMPMLLAMDEIAHCFAMMSGKNVQQHLMFLSSSLLRLFSASSSEYRTRQLIRKMGVDNSRTLTNPCLSIYGTATPQKMGEALTQSNVEDGLLGRFLFCMARNDVKITRANEEFKLPQAVVDRAIQVGTKQPSKPLVIAIDPDADIELVDQMYRFDEEANQATSNPLARMMLVRSYEKLERVAGVLAVWDCPETPTIVMAHVEWATALIESSNSALLKFSRDYMHGGETQTNAYKIERLIRRCLNGELSASHSYELSKKDEGLVARSMITRHSKLNRKQMQDALDLLMELGELRKVSADLTRPNGSINTVSYIGMLT
jgi:hypothetical protein